MKLPFFNPKNQQNKYFFGLFLKNDQGIGFVIEMQGGKLKILEKEKFIFSNGWENLVEDIDEVLFKLENKTKVHLEETILFVYSHLVDEKTKEIKKIYLNRIKELVKNLSLKALGYIECYEAVANYCEKREELPLTAILIELDKQNLGVFVYKGGRISYSKIISRSEDLVADLTAGFEELKGKFLLPSRIILYNSKDLDDESSKILTTKWSEELFIQLPRVEIVQEEEVIEGLIRVFEEQVSTQANIAKKEQETHQEVMGFAIGEDVSKREQLEPRQVKDRDRFKISFFHLTITKIKTMFSKIKPILATAPKQFTFIIGLIFIVVAIFLNELLFHKSDLTIYVPTQQIEKTLTVKGTTDEDAKDQWRIYTANISADFSETKSATGRREIGEKAKGEVTVHNFDEKEKTLAKGTEIDAGGLKFNLDDDIKVASASFTSDGSAKLPGKSKVKVTAAAIGSESNLPKGQRFKINDLPTSLYFAINENALVGGTKKEVNTVSKKDREDLIASVLEKAKSQKQKEIGSKISSGDKLIKELTETELVEAKFSKEVGEEGNSIDLKAKVNTLAFYYKNAQLINFLSNELKEDLKDGYQLDKDKLTYKIDEVSQKGDNITLDLDVKAKAAKNIKSDELIKKIIGKNEGDLKQILKENFAVEGYEVIIRQPLPFFKNKLPIFSKNINLKLSSL